MNWTKPYYGVQHCGEFSTKKPWGTVNDHGSFAVALCWFPGCQFSPNETTHSNAAAAREHVENWLRSQQQ